MQKFKVNDVSPKEISFKYRKKETSVDKIIPNLEIAAEYAKGKVVRTSAGNDENFYASKFSNGLIGTVFQAWSEEHELVLRPENFWVSILTQFSFYVNANAEKLRNKFVNFEGQKDLDLMTHGSLTSIPYDELSKQFTVEIQKNLVEGNVREWLLPKFSTTTVNDEVVCSIVMMSITSKYFKFSATTMCGIPEVTLLGTVEDYKTLAEKVEGLLCYDAGDGLIKKWHSLLKPVCEQLIKSAEGKADVEFWKQICDHRGGSGRSDMSGWLSSFCCFSGTGKWIGVDTFGRGTCEKTPWQTVSCYSIPPGVVSVPLKLNLNGRKVDTVMLSGSFSTKLASETKIEPRLDWAVVLPGPKEDDKNRNRFY